jgi:hypothetical protein
MKNIAVEPNQYFKWETYSLPAIGCLFKLCLATNDKYYADLLLDIICAHGVVLETSYKHTSGIRLLWNIFSLLILMGRRLLE